MRRCIACGRPLKDTDSVIRGYGPKCYEQIFGRNAAKPQHNPLSMMRKRSARASPRKKRGIPGQMTLDFQE